MQIFTAEGWKTVGGSKWLEVPAYPAEHVKTVADYVRSRNAPTTAGWNTKFLHEDPPLVLEVELGKFSNPPQTPVLDWPNLGSDGNYLVRS